MAPGTAETYFQRKFFLYNVNVPIEMVPNGFREYMQIQMKARNVGGTVQRQFDGELGQIIVLVLFGTTAKLDELQRDLVENGHWHYRVFEDEITHSSDCIFDFKILKSASSQVVNGANSSTEYDCKKKGSSQTLSQKDDKLPSLKSVSRQPSSSAKSSVRSSAVGSASMNALRTENARLAERALQRATENANLAREDIDKAQTRLDKAQTRLDKAQTRFDEAHSQYITAENDLWEAKKRVHEAEHKAKRQLSIVGNKNCSAAVATEDFDAKSAKIDLDHFQNLFDRASASLAREEEALANALAREVEAFADARAFLKIAEQHWIEAYDEEQSLRRQGSSLPPTVPSAVPTALPPIAINGK